MSEGFLEDLRKFLDDFGFFEDWNAVGNFWGFWMIVGFVNSL